MDGLERGQSTMRQIRKQLHSFRKKMAALTEATPIEIKRRDHGQNIFKIENQYDSEGAKARERHSR